MLVSTSGVGLGFLGLFFVHGAIAAGAALLAIGVFESVLHPTAATVIADVVPAETRRAHFALRRVMSNAGSMAGPAFGALLALHSLRLVFLGASAALLVGAIIVPIWLRETRPKSANGEANDDDEESLLVLTAVFRDPVLPGFLLPVAVLEIAFSWIQAVTPLYADAAGTLTASGIGLLFAYAGALGVVLQFPLTQASSRLSGFAIVLWSGFMQAVAFALLFVSPALVSLVPAVTLLALSQMLYGPLVQTIIADRARRPRRRPIRPPSRWRPTCATPPDPRSEPGCLRSAADCRGPAAPSSRPSPRSAWPPPRAAMKQGETVAGPIAAPRQPAFVMPLPARPGDLFGEHLEADELHGPNEVTIATSVASRPRAIKIRPMRGVLWRASNVYQRPPR